MYILRRVYGYTQKETAEYLGITVKTVEAHQAKAMVRCADYMAEEAAIEQQGNSTSRNKRGRVAQGSIVMTKETNAGANNPNPDGDSRVLDHRAMVKEQAAVWLIRISDNTLSPNEVDDLREWIGRSDFHREYFIQLSQSWDDMAVLQELAQLFAVPRADNATKAHRGFSFWPGRSPFSGFAVTASVMVCTFVLLLFGNPNSARKLQPCRRLLASSV